MDGCCNNVVGRLCTQRVRCVVGGGGQLNSAGVGSLARGGTLQEEFRGKGVEIMHVDGKGGEPRPAKSGG